MAIQEKKIGTKLW